MVAPIWHSSGHPCNTQAPPLRQSTELGGEDGRELGEGCGALEDQQKQEEQQTVDLRKVVGWFCELYEFDPPPSALKKIIALRVERCHVGDQQSISSFQLPVGGIIADMLSDLNDRIASSQSNFREKISKLLFFGNIVVKWITFHLHNC